MRMFFKSTNQNHCPVSGSNVNGQHQPPFCPGVSLRERATRGRRLKFRLHHFLPLFIFVASESFPNSHCWLLLNFHLLGIFYLTRLLIWLSRLILRSRWKWLSESQELMQHWFLFEQRKARSIVNWNIKNNINVCVVRLQKSNLHDNLKISPPPPKKKNNKIK